jgi:hypothetical protein
MELATDRALRGDPAVGRLYKPETIRSTTSWRNSGDRLAK